MNKFLVFCCVASFCFVVSGAEPTVADNTQSVLVNKVEPVVEPVTVCDKNGCRVTYRNKKNVAPCAVPKTVGVCVEETGCDACCRKVTTRNSVSVDICVPPCPSKESVRSYRGGRRVVYDYGKYEAVVTSDKDGNVEVNYRKRLLGL
jgi:hypothetical protein